MKALAFLTIAILVSSCGKQVKHKTEFVEVSPPKKSQLTCKIYDLSGMGLGTLPDFKTLEVAGTFEVESLNNPVTNNVTAMPMLDDTDFFNITEEFGLVCEGKLKINNHGSHTFYLASDDGSKLYLNNYLAISNDGTHSNIKKSASIILLEDEVTVRVEYFNTFGDKSLTLSYKEVGVSFEQLVKF